MAVKLTQAEKKKTAIGITVFVVIIISYFLFLVNPTKAAKAKAVKDLKPLMKKIETARAQIATMEAKEAEAPKSKLLIDQVNAMIPPGPPVAWFPPKLEEILKNCGVEKPAIVLSTEWPDKEVKDYKHISWGVEVSRITFVDMCKMFQTLENQEPLFEITSIAIESNDADPEYQKVNFVIRNLVRKL